MALQSSGPISLGDIQTEFGGVNPISLSEYYRGGAYVQAALTAIPTSGQISFSNFYGVSAYIYFKNSTTFGLAGGGVQGTSTVATVHSVTWSTFATAVVTSAAFPVAVRDLVYITNETTANYAMNGISAYTSQYIKTTLSTLTSALSVAALNGTTGNGGAIHNDIKGINCGGYNSTTATTVTYGEKIIFATETLSTVNGVLPAGRYDAAYITGYPGGVHVGYLLGGLGPTTTAYPTSIVKIPLSTETGANIADTITMTGRSALSNICSEDVGYALGGWRSGSSTYYNTATKIVFATDTVSNPATAVLPSSIHSMAGMGSNTIGFNTGGQNSAGTRLANVSRTTYATDTTVASTALPAGKAFHGAT